MGWAATLLKIDLQTVPWEMAVFPPGKTLGSEHDATELILGNIPLQLWALRFSK
jgi:hypothetical protein